MIPPVYRFFPAVVCDEFDSPIDALVSLCVPRNEAMELVTAAWTGDPELSVVVAVDGGRRVAVLHTPGGRWAACNAYPELACATRGEAGRRLRKLLKRGRRGYLGVMLA
ncbi:MAG: hypothetical protein ABI478_07520 [Propionivibrio sp.]